MSIGELVDRKEKPAYVTFVREAVEDKAASLAAGHYVAKDVDFVHITPAYTKDIIIRKVSDWFTKLEGDVRNERVPPDWLQHYRKQYEAWQNGQELPLQGTAIKGWGVISPAMQETLIRMNIRTVEDLAGVNDEGMRRIGMGSADLKIKAKAWLQQTEDKGPLTQEIAAVRAENRVLTGQVETLSQQVAALLAAGKVQRGEPLEAPSITAADLMDQEPSDEDLAAKYKAIHGRNPHPAMKREKLIEAVK